MTISNVSKRAFVGKHSRLRDGLAAGDDRCLSFQETLVIWASPTRYFQGASYSHRKGTSRKFVQACAEARMQVSSTQSGQYAQAMMMDQAERLLRLDYGSIGITLARARRAAT